MADLIDYPIDYDGAVQSQARPARAPSAPSQGKPSAREGQELPASEPIDIFHWAAVIVVTALMCAVLGYAAGTPALSRAANVTSLVFGVIGGTLTAGGIARSLRGRLTLHRGLHREPLRAALAKTR
jgi:hypothetical protein